ncbi:UDP-4-amino-4,6-dideoxy-N-acetyl-beta-L-altrosamine N-acetyltransferase [Pistricoccus aurantiacus]|uniref:UDP-4-amino-4, 6-dideoxy-N-acetyl-beta-L-altrosamine N-acetyltransferase n=1 Tax=Pistricoccus aurantiacus TaxID=1883414 RepID=A0A5B8SZ15_9GAMM|nr:UDP-4-amino-4,6-dideoxy-N-acetyl-beta-L-altrosamine N-acetyltransferase [Pistricoccus aurantiacus]QEA40063.1 UDP-4-amino-4,6-dideoxy-N-acetyl-beta-L-altrosamine N-acetyltransferase [Pistricoccus aurantiacus]
MQADDLDNVREWRNHPDVRRYMYTQHEISPDEHHQWFMRASQAPGTHLLIFEQNGVACGFVNITQVKQGPIADWSFHLAPFAQKGTGFQLGCAVLGHVFDHLTLHKLCGEALAFNERSIRLHRRLSFYQEGLLRDQHFDGVRYHDVHRFGILASDWLKAREALAQ